MTYSITEISKITCLTTQTIYVAIRNGRLVARRNDRGQWTVTPEALNSWREATRKKASSNARGDNGKH